MFGYQPGGWAFPSVEVIEPRDPETPLALRIPFRETFSWPPFSEMPEATFFVLKRPLPPRENTPLIVQEFMEYVETDRAKIRRWAYPGNASSEEKASKTLDIIKAAEAGLILFNGPYYIRREDQPDFQRAVQIHPEAGEFILQASRSADPRKFYRGLDENISVTLPKSGPVMKKTHAALEARAKGWISDYEQLDLN